MDEYKLTQQNKTSIKSIPQINCKVNFRTNFPWLKVSKHLPLLLTSFPHKTVSSSSPVICKHAPQKYVLTEFCSLFFSPSGLNTFMNADISKRKILTSKMLLIYLNALSPFHTQALNQTKIPPKISMFFIWLKVMVVKTNLDDHLELTFHIESRVSCLIYRNFWLLVENFRVRWKSHSYFFHVNLID